MDYSYLDSDGDCDNTSVTGDVYYDELKFFDKTLGNTIVTTGGIVEATVNDVVQGVASDDRVGRKCTIRILDVRGQLTLPETTDRADTADRVRLVWFVDKQCNGVIATVLELLETASLDSFRNMPNEGRFDFLSDCTYDLNATCGGPLAFGKLIKGFEFNCEMTLPIEFQGNSGLLETIRSNNIGFLMISRLGLASLTWHSRIRFTDD